MANNPYVNKIQYGNQTLIDLTGDTITADKLLQGYTAHDASGAQIIGTAIPATAISVVDTTDSVAGGTIRTINAVSLAGDTVSPSSLLQGYTAHDAYGQAITGTASGSGGNVIYEASNLTFDGTNYIDTGFAPYSSGNVNKDFLITFKVSSFTPNADNDGNDGNDVVFGCLYEASPWNGFLFRRNAKTTYQLQLTSASNSNVATDAIVGSMAFLHKKGGNFYLYYASQSDGSAAAVSVANRSGEFDQHLLLGCGEQSDGTKFRYFIGTLDYFKIEYL